MNCNFCMEDDMLNKAKLFLLLVLGFGVIFTAGCQTANVTSVADPEESDNGSIQADATVALKVGLWPTTGKSDPQNIYDPFGPRLLPSGYDFHAGIDIKGKMGDPIYASLSGTVVGINYASESTSSGNAITLKHSDGTHTSYLHLSAINVVLNQVVVAGQIIGLMGDSGASYVHLHFAYFVGMPTNTRNEKYSRDPMEILPHTRSYLPQILIQGNRISVMINDDQMDLVKFEIGNGTTTETLSYYEIVKLGSVNRNNTVQGSFSLSVTDPVNNIFMLNIDSKFTPTIVKGYDYLGNVIAIGKI